MGRAIIKKDNGNLAIWSTIVDDFIFTDITKKDYIKFRTEEFKKDLERSFEDYTLSLNDFIKRYGRPTKKQLTALKKVK
jgi:hypothetical protein